jgi:aminopeptidase
MTDPNLENLARVLVDYCVEVKPGDLMRIRGSFAAEPLAREVYRLSVRLGAHPFLDLDPDGITEIRLRESPVESLDYMSPLAADMVERIDVDIHISGAFNSYSLAGVDPARLARFEKIRSRLSRRMVERGEAGDLRWCATLFPTYSGAQNAQMSLTDYEKFVFHAMLVDLPDPVAAWRELSATQQRYCEYLNAHEEIRIQAADTDLTLSVKGRKWINADGHMNFPDGEVFTGPVETSANGHIRYTFPTIHRGRGAADVRLWFEDGLVVRWEAGEGKDLLDELFAMDEGARRLGELAIGTNYAVPTFSKNILFDEKIGGTCHLAVGMGYPSTGSVNESALHWDMIRDLRSGGSITADGEVFHENGEWKI